MARLKKPGWAALWLGLFAWNAGAYPSWPDCPDLQDSDFQGTSVVSRANDLSLAEPIKMAFSLDAAGKVDIYYVERFGGVKRYSGATRAVTQLGKIATSGGKEDGLTGIALDPGFRENNWLYLFYTTGMEFRISRFTLEGNALSQEKIVLKIPHDGGRWHTGGAMKFDEYGDLWITVGEHDAGATGKVPSTNDLRTCILRIHPTADGGYTIPREISSLPERRILVLRST